MSLLGQVFLKLLTPKYMLFKCIKGLVSENPLAVTVLTSPKDSLIVHESTFVLRFTHSELN